MDTLVVIDVQQGMFADPAMQPFDGVAMVGRITGLIAKARKAGVPVTFLQHDGGPGDPLAAEGPGFAFHPALAPREGEAVFVKRNCSAFQDTGFSEHLREQGLTHLIVCGMQTEYCIDTTVRSAFERGVQVTLVSDGHTTFDSAALPAEKIVAHHNVTLGSGFARLCAAEEVRFSG
jgi:nicotinamidase-related amidase